MPLWPHSWWTRSASFSRPETVSVGSISQGSKMALSERRTQAASIPAETDPITSKELLEINQAREPKAPVRCRKWQYTAGLGLKIPGQQAVLYFPGIRLLI